MGLKDSLLSFSEFHAIKTCPNFRSKSDLCETDSQSIYDLSSLPSSGARRHSLSITVGTVIIII